MRIPCDDKPDKKEVFLTGFGGLDHDHSLHSLIAVPDGKWYFNTGNAGPHMVTDKNGWQLRSGSIYNGGTPYSVNNSPARRSDDGRIWVGGLAIRMDSQGKNMEVVGHNFRNSYEVALDSYGNMWQNDNDDQVETCRVTWLMEGGNAGFFNTDGSRTWQADRKPAQDIFTAHWHQDDPGVIPAGDNTKAGSPTGIVVYEGDAFGAKYNGMLLSADAGKNVIFSYQPALQGAGFSLKRSNLISSNQKLNQGDESYVWNDIDNDTRKWFRPSDVAVGTDGAIYISDWYDPVVGGHQMMDTVGYGRIYKITPKGKNLIAPILDLNTVEGQISALLNPAINVRNFGFEKLLHQKENVFDAVKNILTSNNVRHKARAIWLLSQFGEQGTEYVKTLLRNEPDPRLRVVAYRALKNNKEALLDYASIAVDDPSAAVRREVAISLRDVSWEDSSALIIELVDGYDGKDPWYLEALGMALDGKEEIAYRQLVHREAKNPINWSQKFATLVWRLHPKSAIPGLKQRALAENLPDSLKKQAVDALAFINDKNAVAAMLELQENKNNANVQKLADCWVNYRKNNDWHTLWNWKADKDGLSFKIPKKVAALQKQLLNSSLAQELRINAGKKLAKTLIGGRLLISLANDKKIPQAIIDGVSDEIFKNPELEIRTLASEHFKRPGGKQLSVSSIIRLKGEPIAGKEIFNTTCTACHKNGNIGFDIGPDLSSIGEKFDKAALLDAIINPNASIVFGYNPMIIKTKAGQAVYGFLLSEGKTTVLKGMSGKKIVINTNDIESKQQMKIGIMPDAMGLGLSNQDLSNLASYLLNSE